MNEWNATKKGKLFVVFLMEFPFHLTRQKIVSFSKKAKFTYKVNGIIILGK